MVKYLTVLLATLVVGCAAGNTKDPSVIEQDDAIDDYIKVAELPSTDAIRSRKQVHYKQITDRYIILHDNKKDWLVKFRRRCHELNDLVYITPDVRYESNVIRARFDTYRGCHIDEIYEVNEGQAEELIALGD